MLAGHTVIIFAANAFMKQFTAIAFISLISLIRLFVGSAAFISVMIDEWMSTWTRTFSVIIKTWFTWTLGMIIIIAAFTHQCQLTFITGFPHIAGIFFFFR